jgi:hypothetical protein
MSLDPYATATKGVKDALLAIVKTTTTFSTHAYAHYIQKVTGNPTAFVRLRNDSFQAVGPKETYHRYEFSIQINYRGSYTESSLDAIIGYVGEIVDVIEADRNLSSAYVESTEIKNVDYTFREAQQAVFHYAYISVEVTGLRNM